MVLPSSTRSSENAPSPLPSSSTIDPSALLQRARSWTAQHLDVAKVKIIEDMTAWEFLGAEYVPADGDLEFERVAGLFCEPSREQLECGNPGYCIREDNGHLHSVFTWLCSLPQADITENVHVFKEFLNQFIAEIMFMTGHYRNFTRVLHANVPYNVPQLNFRGKLPSDGTITGWDREKKTNSVPLVILSVVRDPSHSSIAQYEVPRAMLLAVIAFANNSGLDYYDGFVILLNGTSLHISRAMVSREYLQNLFEHKIIENDMPFHISESFDLLDACGRRESVRFIMGIFRYLLDSEQWKIPGNYERKFV